MSELKTLKDFEYSSFIKGYNECRKDLKKEAIKWVKEDEEVLKRLHQDNVSTWDILTRKWMKRFNIKEEDLK